MARVVHPGAAGFVPPADPLVRVDDPAAPPAADAAARAGYLSRLAEAAPGCRGCNLFADATQVVFGTGPASARVVLVGEQPGDVEDQRGEPFVGPAGTLLNRALREAGIEREAAYVTNAVKHFRWAATAGSARRLHVKPDAGHVNACRPWLAAELRAVGPQLVVALGATAAQALLGPQFRVTQQRGVLLDWPPESGPFAGPTAGTRPAARAAAGPADAGAADGDSWSIEQVLATIHPSAVLRADPGDRDQMFGGFVSDLRVAAAALA